MTSSHNDPYYQRNQRGFDPNINFNQNNFDNFLFDQGLENYRSDIDIPQYRHVPEYNTKAPEKADLLSSQIKFEPKFFDSDLTQKKYRGTNIVLSVKSQLPQILLTSSLQKKIQKNLSQSAKKDSLIFASSQTDDNEPEKKFIIDEISYSLEESEENYYDVNKYPLLLVTSPLPDASYEDNFELDSEMGLIEDFCKKCRMGAFALLSQESLFNQKNTDFSAPFQDTDHGALTSADLVYLNMFRIFTFLFKTKISNTSRYIAQRLLYFPNVSFKIACIQQPFKLVATPLNNLVTKRSKSEPGEPRKKPNIKFGFVSLDANQRMLFFMTSDPLAAQIPLIGLWVYGINPHLDMLDDESQEKNVLQGILFEYINSTLKNRYSFDKIRKTFLLAIFSPEEGAKYYEVEFGEKMGNDENENRWVMLKTSRETSSINEALDFLQRGFMLSNENITKDLASIKKSIMDNTQSSFRDNYSSAKRNQSNDSLSNYLSSNAKQQPKDAYFDAEEEADNFDITPHQLPQKPQSPPQREIQPLPLLNQSGSSLKTASFLGGNEDTFAQDSSRNGERIPFFPDPSGTHKKQYSPQEKEKLSPFAEQLISNQNQQLKFLQDQILTLQTALLTVQTNPSQGLLQRLPGLGLANNNNAFPIDMNHPDTGKFGSNKKSIVFPEPKQTVDRGCDPITEDWLMSQNYYGMNGPRNYYPQPGNMIRNEQPRAPIEMNRNGICQMPMNRYAQERNQNSYENERMDERIRRQYQEYENQNRYENERGSHRNYRPYEEYENQNPLHTEMENSQHSQPLENSEEYDHREYQSTAYSSNKRYNEPAPVIENRYEEPKLSSEDFRNNNTHPPRSTETRLEDDGRRLLKDITNDTRNYPEPSQGRNERVQQQDNYESVDLRAKQESSHKSSATKENEPAGTSQPIVTKAFAEDQPAFENEKPINKQKPEISREEPKKTMILAPLEEKETSIQIPKMRFGTKKIIDSDSEDEELSRLAKKYLGSGK